MPEPDFEQIAELFFVDGDGNPILRKDPITALAAQLRQVYFDAVAMTKDTFRRRLNAGYSPEQIIAQPLLRAKISQRRLKRLAIGSRHRPR